MVPSKLETLTPMVAPRINCGDTLKDTRKEEIDQKPPKKGGKGKGNLSQGSIFLQQEGGGVGHTCVNLN